MVVWSVKMTECKQGEDGGVWFARGFHLFAIDSELNRGVKANLKAKVVVKQMSTM